LDDEDKNQYVEETQDETVYSSLRQFAELAECCVGSSSSKVVDTADAALARRVIQVKNAVEPMALQVKAVNHKQAPILSVFTQQDVYKSQLGPLRFHLCPKFSHHHFSKSSKSPAHNSRQIRNLFKELTSYKTTLPVEYGSSIFVRAVENRLDTLRAVILGPDDTPYANGVFVFDIFLPYNYPLVAPMVHFVNHGGRRFNPNLYNCGKVCLSLLGTWSGPGWISGESSLLQVLISLQSLILVPDPYFNEPGCEVVRNTPCGLEYSNTYNTQIRSYTATISMEPILKSLANGTPTPYPEFDEVFRKHFCNKRSVIEQQMRKWEEDDAKLKSTFKRIQDYLTTLFQRERPAKKRRQAAFDDHASKVIRSSSSRVAKRQSEMESLPPSTDEDRLWAFLDSEASMFAGKSKDAPVVLLDEQEDNDRKMRPKANTSSRLDVIDLT
jgi:baculoviral IAP repeat-containing protein 6